MLDESSYPSDSQLQVLTGEMEWFLLGGFLGFNPNLSSTLGICTGFNPGLMCAGFAGTFGFSTGLFVTFWEMLLKGRGRAEDSGDRELVLDREDILVSSPPPLVRVPVIVTSDSDMKLDSYDFAPCKVLVVQSEQPEVVENEEILLSNSSTDLAVLGSLTCQLGARGLGDSGHAREEEDSRE